MKPPGSGFTVPVGDMLKLFPHGVTHEQKVGVLHETLAVLVIQSTSLKTTREFNRASYENEMQQ
jgi:hypothetical protein